MTHRSQLATALLGCVAVAALSGGCAAASVSSPAGGQSSAPGAASPKPAASAGGGGATPAPSATITDGPVPAAALQAATRYWRLIDAGRNAALLRLVTPDSRPPPPCVRARRRLLGHQASQGGVGRVATADPAPPAGATIEFDMTVDITPSASSPWSAGRTTVF